MNPLSRPRRVLIIENDPALRGLLAEMTASVGHIATVAATAADGLAQALADPPDVVFMDLYLDPGDRGNEVYRRLRENDRTRDVAVIICTVQRQNTVRRALGPTSPADPRLWNLFKPFALLQARLVLQQALADPPT